MGRILKQWDENIEEWVVVGVPNDTIPDAIYSNMGIVINNHGSDAQAPRKNAAINYWIGTVKPENGLPADLLYLEED